MADFHPFINIFEHDPGSGQFFADDVYFNRPDPTECAVRHSYTNRSVALENTTTYQWSHSLGEIVNACVNNGVVVRALDEYPYLFINRYPGLFEERDGLWFPADPAIDIPMTFSITGTRAT